MAPSGVQAALFSKCSQNCVSPVLPPGDLPTPRHHNMSRSCVRPRDINNNKSTISPKINQKINELILFNTILTLVNSVECWEPLFLRYHAAQTVSISTVRNIWRWLYLNVITRHSKLFLFIDNLGLCSK